MASSRIRATGVPTTPGANGSLPLRREIRDLQANYRDQWNLYILGLQDLQKKPVTDLLSYYQLSGIHGEPFVTWNGVTGNQNASFGGYCTHSSILFLTWHRPYLAVYEQALYASVQSVASKFPEPLRARYVAAAKDFRMPYWDWAARITPQTSAFPTAVSSSSITVVDVDGATKQINNPLYSFRFDDKTIPDELSLPDYWSRFPNTKRSPSRSGSSQNDLVSRVITNEAASLRNNVSLVLLSYKQFDAVSNNAWLRSGTPGRYGSLEDLHNEIHDKIGQGGHMGSLEVSAFDPVFWLHHTNVDRLWGIWQALNPNSYAIDKTVQAREANFTMAAGTRVTANTELKPFYDTSGTRFWDSTGVKGTTPFGYAYPETQRWNYPSDQVYQAAVRNEVTRQYGANVINNFFANVAAQPMAASAAVGGAAAPPSAMAASAAAPSQHVFTAAFAKKAVAHPVETAKEMLGKKPDAAPAPAAAVADAPHAHAQQPLQAEVTPTTGPTALNIPKQFEHLVPNRTYVEWITNLRAVKHGLSQTFRVYVFLGDFNPDPTTWPTEFNVVGRFTVLGRGGDTQCEKCQQDQTDELIVTGTVPLTSALLQDITVEGANLGSLNPEDVEPYLVKNLHWRVTVFDGSEKPREEVPGLKISVVSTKVTIGDDGVPVYSGEYREHPNITDGRPAGFTSGDDI